MSSSLSDEMQAAYSFLKDYEALLRELRSVLDAVRHVEDICNDEVFSILSSQKCKLHIIANVIGYAHYRQAKAGLKMLEYFEKKEKLLTKSMNINTSSDIIESTFSIYKSKKFF